MSGESVKGYFPAGPDFRFVQVDAAGRLLVAAVGSIAVPERYSIQRDAASSGPVLVLGALCWGLSVAKNLHASLTGYLMIFDQAIAPAVGDSPIAIVEIDPGETAGLGGLPTSIVNKLWWAASTTETLYGVGAGAPTMDVTTWWSATP
jgi:hypothetical protein